MARAVADALDNHDTLVVEAGTGTGKTFAYLVPALLSGKRVLDLHRHEDAARSTFCQGFAHGGGCFGLACAVGVA